MKLLKTIPDTPHPGLLSISAPQPMKHDEALDRLLPGSSECHSRSMRRKFPLGAFAALLLCCSLPAVAQDKGYWRAVSSNANGITGDLTISDSRLSINMTAFPIAQIRPLKAAESSAVFDADPGEGGSGYLYRLSVPGARRFLHRNTLCGSDDTQWMATYVHGRALRVAFFSGTDMPVFTPDALANSSDVCGTFSYSR